MHLEQQFKYHSALTIAGSDSGGGAGIQADLKTFSALGCFGTSAITAITVQNTCGVEAVHGVPPDIVAAQIFAVIDDIAPGAVKIGMVHSQELIHAIAGELKKFPELPVVLDPVMISTSGHRLIEPNTVSCLVDVLFPLSTLITPNIHEAEILTGISIKDLEGMKLAAQRLLKLGCGNVLLKGGHLPGSKLYDVLAKSGGKITVFESRHIESHNTHGTGCTLSSAIAAYLCREYDLVSAIESGISYVTQAVFEGADVNTGKGHGPLNHFFNPLKLIKL